MAGSKLGRPRHRRGAGGPAGSAQVLPATLARLFWDYPWRSLRLDRHRDLVVRRVAAEGGLREIRALRARFDDASIRAVILRTGARGLSPRRIRFWQLVLDVPATHADAWVRQARAGTWARRQRH